MITDNDGKQESIDEAEKNNQNSDDQKIFMDKGVNNFTWETCIYKLNKDILDKEIKVSKGSLYKFNGRDYGQVLGKMLNNKVDVAYAMLLSNTKYEIPQYVKNAIRWIK